MLAVLFFCAYTGTPLVLALFLQDGLGFTPLQSGLTASAYAVGAAVSAPSAAGSCRASGAGAGRGARALRRRGGRRLRWSASCRRPGGAGGGRAVLAPVAAAGGPGRRSVITPNQALSLAEVDARGGSTAGGMLQTSQRIGNALGAAVITAVFYAASRRPRGRRTGRPSTGTRTRWDWWSASCSPWPRSRWQSRTVRHGQTL